MKNSVRILLGLVGVCVAALCWVDATQWIDVATGFPQVGSAAMRYIAWLMLCVLAVLTSGLAVRRPAALAKRSWGIVAADMLAGVVYVAAGAFQLAKIAPNLQLILENAALPYGYQDKMMHSVQFFVQTCAGDIALAVCAWIGAWTFFVQASYWGKDHKEEAPAGNIYFAMLGMLYPCVLALERFFTHTSSIYRVYHVLQLGSVMIVLIFQLSMLRVCFFPETGKARSCVRNGLLCFYTSSCCEFVFSLSQWKAGLLSSGELMVSGVFGAMGVLGLAYALQLINPDEKAYE